MKSTKIYTRPSKDIKWWTEIMPEDVKNRYKTEYKDPGYFLKEEFIESEDGLTLTWISEWIDDPIILYNFLSDSVIITWKINRDRYCEANNISYSHTHMSYIKDGITYAGYWEDGTIQPVEE